MQSEPANGSAGDLRSMRSLVRTFFEKRMHNKILKYHVERARRLKQKQNYLILLAVVTVLLAGLSVYLGQIALIAWLLGLAVLVAIGMQIYYYYPRPPEPSEEEFRQCYDKLLANDQKQLLQKACEGLRIAEIGKENFPLWGIWGEFGEHRRDVSAEPEVLRDALGCEEGKLRCTPLALTAFTFDDQHMHVFQGAADISIGNIIFDSVREIAYSDIAGIAHHRTTKEFRLAEFKPETVADIRACGLWGAMQQKAISGIIASGDNDFFEIALHNGQRVNAVFRDVDLMLEDAYEYRYVQRTECEIEDGTFRPGKLPSMRDLIADLSSRIGAKKAEAAARRPSAPQ